MPENLTGTFDLIPPYEKMPPVNTAKDNLGKLECCLFFVMDEIL